MAITPLNYRTKPWPQPIARPDDGRPIASAEGPMRPPAPARSPGLSAAPDEDCHTEDSIDGGESAIPLKIAVPLPTFALMKQRSAAFRFDRLANPQSNRVIRVLSATTTSRYSRISD
jgi:hypothetical protein